MLKSLETGSYKMCGKCTSIEGMHFCTAISFLKNSFYFAFRNSITPPFLISHSRKTTIFQSSPVLDQQSTYRSPRKMDPHGNFIHLPVCRGNSITVYSRFGTHRKNSKPPVLQEIPGTGNLLSHYRFQQFPLLQPVEPRRPA